MDVINSIGVIFVILKLVGVLQWSWWWILAPFWIQLVIIVLMFTWLHITNVIDQKKYHDN